VDFKNLDRGTKTVDREGNEARCDEGTMRTFGELDRAEQHLADEEAAEGQPGKET